MLREKIKDFLHRRVVSPLIAQLRQGSSPDELASSLACGAAVSIFPIVGTTTALGFVVGHFFKLNHVALQMMNYLLLPLHLATIIPFLKLGDGVFGYQEVSYSIAAMFAEFESSPSGFLKHYGFAAARAALMWLVVVPIPALILRQLLRPWLRRLASKIPSR